MLSVIHDLQIFLALARRYIFYGYCQDRQSFFSGKNLTTWCAAINARENRGKHILLRTVKDAVSINALGWSDKKGKEVVFTTGTSLAADPSVRRRHKPVLVDGRWEKKVYYKNVPRPDIIKELIDALMPTTMSV